MIKPVSKIRLKFSRRLRKQPTPWEVKLWQHLKNNNLGFRFKRQLVLGNYIVDFCCHGKKLVIELDGSSHRPSFRKEIDQAKLVFLRHEGYNIIRFWNHEIDKDISVVLNKIIKALNSIIGTTPPTPPTHPR